MELSAEMVLTTTAIGAETSAIIWMFFHIIKTGKDHQKELLVQEKRHKDEVMEIAKGCAAEKEKLQRETLMALAAQARALEKHAQLTKRRKVLPDDLRLLPESSINPRRPSDPEETRP